VTYLRVSVGTWSIDQDSPQGNEVFQKIRDEGLRVLQRQPGFIDYRHLTLTTYDGGIVVRS